VVEMEIKKTPCETGTTSTATLNVSEIITQVKDFIDKVRATAQAGKPTAVNVESFNVSVGKANGEYIVSFDTKILLTPKEA